MALFEHVWTPRLAMGWHPSCTRELRPSMQTPFDRRRWQRLPLTIPLFVQPSDHRSGEQLEFAAAVNISAGGALLQTKSYFPLDSIITLRIPASPSAAGDRREQVIEATVIRFQARGKGFELAVQFAEPLIVTASAGVANFA
jgi:hypothetical protein